MIVFSTGFVLSAAEAANPNGPLIGADNIVTASNIVADLEEANFPASNLGNPATDLEWRSTGVSAGQYLTITTGTADDLDYAGLAGHNLGSAGVAVSLEADDGGGFDVLVAPFVPVDDKPLLFRFDAAPYAAVRFKFAGGSAAPTAAVAYLGELLVLPRSIYVGHSPLTYARNPEVVNGQSQSGRYLGTVETGLSNSTEIALKNLDPDWYRQYLDPVVESRTPFFFAWRPDAYPLEVGFVWVTNNPRAANQRSNGMQQITLNVEGEA